MTALLEIAAARIDQDGVPLIEGLSLTAMGSTLGLVGDFHGLFSLLGGTADLVTGQVSVLGHEAERAVAAGVVGVARAEFALPETWNLDRYLIEGARLGGVSRREASQAVGALLGRLALTHLATRRLSTLTLGEQRSVGIALALLDSPAVLAVEDPTLSLDDRGVELICGVIGRAREGRHLLVSSRALPRSGPEHALFEGADEVIVLTAGALVGRGPLSFFEAPGHRYLVSVLRGGGPLVERLESAGLEVAIANPSGQFVPVTGGAGSDTAEAARLVVSVPEAGTTDAIVEAALQVGAPIVELLPLPSLRSA